MAPGSGVGRLVLREVRNRPRRALALVTALLVAASGFVLLTASVSTTQARTTGTLRSAFRPAYDLLVRPRGAVSVQERRRGLISDGFGSGLFGGISFRQLARIRKTVGVSVAAPVANIGYVLPSVTVVIPVNRYLTAAPEQLFRIRPRELSARGLSAYPLADSYVYYTRRDPFQKSPKGDFPVERTPSGLVDVCDGPGRATPKHPQSPFDTSLPGISCFSALTPRRPFAESQVPPGQIAATIEIQYPLLLSAVDPAAEAKLVGLNRTIINGRYLRPGEGLTSTRAHGFQGHAATIPMLADSTSYLDQTLQLTIQRLDVAGVTDLPRTLAAGTMPTFAGHLRGKTVAVTRRPARQDYPAVLRRYERNSQQFSLGDFTEYRQAGPVTYRSMPGGLAPVVVHNPSSVWRSGFTNGFLPVPTANDDTAFRRLHIVSGTNDGLRGTDLLKIPTGRVVGQFDPRKLTDFSPLSRVPLETYFPPQATGANASSRAALRGKTLLPDANLAGYLSQPPSLLTTLRAARESFWNRAYFKGSELNPISYIRVRVAGVTGPNPTSLARLNAAASAIHQRTGLRVDITDGSSPRALPIRLPAGHFGRPALTVSEGWVDKGVSVGFLRAADRKSLLLFVLLLVVCALFLGNAALAGERARRPELGILACIGWTRGALFGLVIAQQALLGAVAGVLGTAAAAALVHGLGLELPTWRLSLIAPVAVLLACLSGLLAARRAARTRPLDAVAAPARRTAGRRRVRSVTGLAAANLTRVPGRTVLGVVGLLVSVAALTVLAGLSFALRGVLVGTLLGNTISLQVRGVDYLAVGLMMLLAAVSVADVAYLNLSERRPELATLIAFGWPDRTVRRILVTEGLLVAASASTLGAAVGAAFVLLTFPAGVDTTIAVAAGAAVCGVLLAAVALAVPLRAARDRFPAATLSAAE